MIWKTVRFSARNGIGAGGWLIEIPEILQVLLIILSDIFLITGVHAAGGLAVATGFAAVVALGSHRAAIDEVIDEVGLARGLGQADIFVEIRASSLQDLTRGQMREDRLQVRACGAKVL